MAQQQTPPQTVTLEQAWFYLTSQWALRNPGKVFEANLARKALQRRMVGASKGW